MDIFSDWKFWMFIMQFITMGGGILAFAIIKFNDFKHVEEAIKKQTITIEEIGKIVAIQGQQIAKIEGKLGIK